MPITGITYKVEAGDTLWAISRRFLNDPRKWPSIYWANRNVIRIPDLIKPGMTLSIPVDHLPNFS